MSENHVLGVVLQPAERNKSPALQLLASSGNREMLRVAVDRRLGILKKNPLPPPILKVRCRPSVSVISRAVGRFPLAQNDAHQIMRAGGVVALLHLRRDLVVGLSDDFGEINPSRVVSQSTERSNVGHGRQECTKNESMRHWHPTSH